MGCGADISESRVMFVSLFWLLVQEQTCFLLAMAKGLLADVGAGERSDGHRRALCWPLEMETWKQWGKVIHKRN